MNPGISDLSPLTSGWNLEEEKYAIHWFDGAQFPSSIELEEKDEESFNDYTYISDSDSSAESDIEEQYFIQ